MANHKTIYSTDKFSDDNTKGYSKEDDFEFLSTCADYAQRWPLRHNELAEITQIVQNRLDIDKLRHAVRVKNKLFKEKRKEVAQEAEALGLGHDYDFMDTEYKVRKCLPVESQYIEDAKFITDALKQIVSGNKKINADFSKEMQQNRVSFPKKVELILSDRQEHPNFEEELEKLSEIASYLYKTIFLYDKLSKANPLEEKQRAMQAKIDEKNEQYKSCISLGAAPLQLGKTGSSTTGEKPTKKQKHTARIQTDVAKKMMLQKRLKEGKY